MHESSYCMFFMEANRPKIFQIIDRRVALARRQVGGRWVGGLVGKWPMVGWSVVDGVNKTHLSLRLFTMQPLYRIMGIISNERVSNSCSRKIVIEFYTSTRLVDEVYMQLLKLELKNILIIAPPKSHLVYSAQSCFVAKKIIEDKF